MYHVRTRSNETVEGSPCKRCGSSTRLKSTGRCQSCHRAYNKNRYQKPEVKEQHKINMRRFQAASGYNLSYYRKHKEQLGFKQRERNYGLCKEALEQILQQQIGLCAICSCSIQTKYCVDHDHKTQKVRGLLCSRCNLLIGMAKDSVELLHKAASYLEKINAE